MPWFGVRSHYRFSAQFGARDVFEERVLLFEAADAGAALAEAEAEAAAYVTNIEGEVLDLFQTFEMFDEPASGSEIYSLMRVSDLEPTVYLGRFFDTGDERSS